MTGLVATASTLVDADQQTVWRAITDPAEVKQWFFGTDLATDWKPGSAITWSGDYEGTSYQDKGEVVAVDEPDRLEVTHFSPMTGQEDRPENYHTLVYALVPEGQGTTVTITQDNNGDQEEADRNAATWTQMLESLKQHLARS